MSIGFNAIPNTLLVPVFAAEFDNSRANQGPALLPYRALIIAQRTSAGTSAAGSFTKVTNENQALLAAGRGSQGHRMAKAWFANNKSTEVWLGLVDDNAAGVLATKTITFTGNATAAGTVNMYVGGTLVQVAVAVSDTPTIIALALSTAITAALDLPVTSAVVAGVATLTARNKGTVGQDLDLRVNYQDGEATPAGVSIAFATGVTGITNPSLTALIAAMGDTWYQVTAHPFTDATSLTSIETELVSRFGPMRMIDGVAITSALGSSSVLATLGLTRNCPHSCIAAQAGSSPITPPSEYAAAVAATVAFYANIDPARPLQTLPLSGVKSPAEANLFTMTERDLLLHDGIGTTKAAAGGIVQLERIVTTYQTNAAGAADPSYRDVTTMLTLLYLRYTFRNRMMVRYPRSKLANDGTRVSSGQAIITPKIGKAEAITWFREMEELGLVEGFDQFKNDLVVARNVSDPNRLDFLLPPDLINALIVTAIKIQFLL